MNVQPGTKLESGAALLHLCNNLLGIARDIPPVVLAHWRLTDLRRYGAVPNGFIFEGGTRCGYCEYQVVFCLCCSIATSLADYSTDSQPCPGVSHVPVHCTKSLDQLIVCSGSRKVTKLAITDSRVLICRLLNSF